ncbi:hypothetical protein PENSPDRAFT_686253 [Peniophora sp. CONT]|nr:hypothetical protein PENSPDRAFT_686253 [Peniophora sp. CONT]
MSGDKIHTLPNGYEYVLVHFYTSGEAKANILPTIISFFELFATVGLLTAIVLSAVFTRNAKDSNLFVRTSLVFYFVSALVCEALSALSGVMTATWISDMQVFSGGLCTAQGFFRHFSDVGMAIWTVVITVQAFIVLWRAQEYSDAQEIPSFTIYGRQIPSIVFYKWFILATTWFAIGFIVMLGPAIGSSTNHGDFYGVFGESCGITAGYLPESVVFSSLVIIIAFITSIGLFTWISYVIKPRSAESIVEAGFAEKQHAEKLSVEVARYMTWYPLVYFICVLPAIIETIIFWSGTAIPLGYSVFVDTVYHLMGIINASVFIFTPHPGPLLPHKPESPPPPEGPRDLNAEAEKVIAKMVSAVALQAGDLGQPKDVPPPAEPSPNKPDPLIRRPSRGREPAFPLASTSPDPVEVYVDYRVESRAHDVEGGLTPISERTEGPPSAAQGEKPEAAQQGDETIAKQEEVNSLKGEEDSTSAHKSETRQSGVPSSVYSQNSHPSPSLPSPLRIVVPSRSTTRPGHDQPFPIITLPSNPRPKGVEVRVNGTEEQPEVKIVVQPPPYHSPPSPQTAPATFDPTLVAAVRDASSSNSPSPSPSPEPAGSKSRFAKEQDRFIRRVVRESRSFVSVSRRTIPVPWLPQRPDGEPQSPDSFMDAEAAAIERTLSEKSGSNPESPNVGNGKRKVRFASQASNEWYVGLLQAAGLGARVSRNDSKTRTTSQSEPEVPHSAPVERRPVSDVATAWKPYRDAFKAASTGTIAKSEATSPLSGESDATLHSAEPMAAAWRPYTETQTLSPDVKKVEVVVGDVPQPSIIVTEVDVTEGPVSGLEDEVLVAQRAQRPEVPPQAVLLKTVQPQADPDLDAVLNKWGAKAATKSNSRAVTPGNDRSVSEYGMESLWTVRPVPEEEGVWECEERILDSYFDRSRDSLPRAGLVA